MIGATELRASAPAPVAVSQPTAPFFTGKISSGRVLAFAGTANIPASQWERFSGASWKDHRFQELAEETLYAGIEHACLLVEDAAGEILALQPVFVIRQDLALGTPLLLTRAIRAVRRVWPHFLQPRMLMVGSLAGEGQLAIDRQRPDKAISALQEGIELFARQNGVRLITYKEFPAHTRAALRTLSKGNYAHVPSYPSVRMPIAHVSFEKHLEHLTAATRKDLRRKFRESEACGAVRMEVIERPSSALIDEFHALYRQVFERSEVRFECLTRDYFAQVSEVLPDRVRWFLWRYEGRVVAFKLCFVHEEVFYDDYIGLDYSVALKLHLYFVTFRDLYSWAATQGLRKYYSTPLSYDPKLRLGFQLAPLDLYVRHMSPLVNAIYKRLAASMGPTAGDSTLVRFPNHQDL